ncbi:Superfamily I DNA and RNA helicases [[Clostridium] sordellii]|uniref:DEAD/DEAH box helicase n=1 Tax=Paraclostridium sordellii TaxID=1505 RepID=UPI0005EA4728|nr:ATP-binding domain-containing protein [Paeniclostridium sordellii]CEP94665.1 Superfamily I DNA and RNA helicases [[Clostridium] sordellii] [Paeniclostridium sordellii]
MLLSSPDYGIVIFKCDSTSKVRDQDSLKEVLEELLWMEDNVFSRLLQSSNKRLKSGRRNLAFNVSSVLFAPNLEEEEKLNTECCLVTNKGELLSHFNEIKEDMEKVDDEIISDALAIIEGSIAITRPKERILVDGENTTKASIMKKLEDEIAKFDDTQKYAALSQINGPQRIRGLAGSGKTIILCMKAALLHLKYPDKKILYTFMTKSLYDYIEKLITRFYKVIGDGSLPDLEKCIQIRHAWGGENIKGVYYEAARRNNIDPISFSDAARTVGRGDAFNYICEQLLLDRRGNLEKTYDYVFIDEAQDFGPSFYKLCRSIVKNDCIVWGYDELQNIFNIDMQDTNTIFKDDRINLKGIDLVELQKQYPDMDNDIVLSKSYRNLKEIIVLAHAIGFGIYNDTLIQSLENDEHWRDLGYSIIKGTCENGHEVKIERPDLSSPLANWYNRDVEDIIKMKLDADFEEEIRFVCDEIEDAIKIDKLRADDIMVICLDDRHAKGYFYEISENLYKRDIYTHNLTSNSYEKGFIEDDCVTLTTVYKAKGNESAMVFIVGCDVFESNKDSISMRNKLFTSITRAKAWIRLSGLSKHLQNEITKVKNNKFILEFTYKDSKVIKRDLTEINAKKSKIRDKVNNLIINLEKDGYSKDDIIKFIEDLDKGGK